MDINSNMKVFKFKISFLLISIISLISVVDINKMLNRQTYLNQIDSKVSFLDTAITTLYGLNGSHRILFIDRIRWTSIYILFIYLIGIYINNIIINENKYMWIIRSKSYIKWVITHITTIIISLIIYILYYCGNVLIFSYILCDIKFNTTKIFSILNPYLDKSFLHIADLFLIIGVIVTSVVVLVLIQFITSIITMNSNKGAILAIITIILSSFIAETNLINPFMLSRYNLIDNRVNYNPYISIYLNVALIIGIIVFFLINIRKIRKE